MVRSAASGIVDTHRFHKRREKDGARGGVGAADGAGGNGQAQAVSTTTVQGTVFLANGQPGAGSVTISWPSFTTAAGQAVAADWMNVTIPADGFVSVSLAPNVGATPAGEYYTAIIT